jgi:hypothetical protein
MKKYSFFGMASFALGLAFLLVFVGPAVARDLYVTQTDKVFKFKVDGSSTTIASGLGRPEGLVLDSSGNLFVADNQSGTIFKFTPTLTKSTFASGVSNVFSLAIDSKDNLYASQLDVNNTGVQSGSIFKFTPTGTQSTFASGLNEVIELAVDGADNVFAADFQVGMIFKFAPNGTKSTFTAQNFPPSGLAIDSSGNVFVTDSQSGTIFKFTPKGVKRTFASGIDKPFALASGDFGNLFAPVPNVIDVIAPDGKVSGFSGISNAAFVALGPPPPLPPQAPQFLNISTRSHVGTGDDVLIAGFIVGVNLGGANRDPNGAVIVRAIGPSLTVLGVAGALQDPMLELHNANGELIRSNDNWKEHQGVIQATGLAPTDDRESAILAELAAGAYTAIIRGAHNTTGIAVIQVYNLQ